MHILFYSNISDFAGNLEGMLDEGTCKTTVQNMHKLGSKSQLFKSADVLMLGHCCGVSQYPQFYFRIYYHVHMLEVIKVKCFTNFYNNHRLLNYPKKLRH